jgi:type I restriction enzyme S subunit
MSKVPKLRFKEFSGDWEEKRLGEVAKIIMGQSPNSSAYNEDFEGVPLIQGNADCKNRKIKVRLYTTEITKKSNRGDIIMSVRAPAGTIATSNIESCIGRGVCAIRGKKEAQKFIFQYLINYEKKWQKYSQGSTFDSINSNVIKELEVLFPLLPEQEEISSFLSSVDTKIEKIEKKVELLKQYKKGMMQKIFSQEIRFKDENGNDYPDWVEKELGEFVNV